MLELGRHEDGNLFGDLVSCIKGLTSPGGGTWEGIERFW